MKTLSIDDQVKHKAFGIGTIQAVIGIEDFAKYTIKFDKKVTKLIMAPYVKLVKVVVEAKPEVSQSVAKKAPAKKTVAKKKPAAKKAPAKKTVAPSP